MSTVFTSTPSLNHRSSSLILTSFVLFCLFLIRPLSAKVQSSRPYDLHHWPVVSCHSYQNWTAICPNASVSSQDNLTRGQKGDLIISESEQLLPQPISRLHGPLVGQELLDGVSALEELAAVAPDGVRSVCELWTMSAGICLSYWVRACLVCYASSPKNLSLRLCLNCWQKTKLKTDLHGSRVSRNVVRNFPSSSHRTTHFVFHASWAALTFLLAVSRVKGGKGGLDSVAMLVVS